MLYKEEVKMDVKEEKLNRRSKKKVIRKSVRTGKKERKGKIRIKKKARKEKLQGKLEKEFNIDNIRRNLSAK
jgi:stress response protein YsnF